MGLFAMESHNNGLSTASRRTSERAAGDENAHPAGTRNGVTGAASAALGDAPRVSPLPDCLGSDTKRQRARSSVPRGISSTLSSTHLQRGIWLRALLTANRFRVIRTVDLAVCCFAERSFKAALTAAQRAMRGLVKADLLRRYRTDRFQTVYGLTQRGVEYLEEAGFDASSSVRRVSDMTNPEHRLWAQFLVLASEARGLQAMTEQELLQHLNAGKKPGDPLVQGLLPVEWTRGSKTVRQHLRPDAIAFEPAGDNESRSAIWFEVDRSKRGSDRESALSALVRSVGRPMLEGSTLVRVVVYCKTSRIEKRALAVVHALALANNGEVLVGDRRHLREVEQGIFEIWVAQTSKLGDGRTKVVDALAGHVIVQPLPTWLPRVRIDAQNKFSMAGWFEENYLPYRRPIALGRWATCDSPLLKPPRIRTQLAKEV